MSNPKNIGLMIAVLPDIKETRVSGARQLVKEISYDLETLFGDIPYTVKLVDAYGYDAIAPAVLWVAWWPEGLSKNPQRAWWMILARTDNLHDRFVRTAIVEQVGWYMMRVKG